MYCTSCGQQNYSDAHFCQNCGRELQSREMPDGYRPPGPRPHVPNHLVWAILATIFCCIPFGIVSIVYAAQVNGKLAGGDYRGARSASDNARTWAIASIVLGLTIAVVNFGLLIAGAYIFPFT